MRSSEGARMDEGESLSLREETLDLGVGMY
jgi:hypothetical protein